MNIKSKLPIIVISFWIVIILVIIHAFYSLRAAKSNPSLYEQLAESIVLPIIKYALVENAFREKQDINEYSDSNFVNQLLQDGATEEHIHFLIDALKIKSQISIKKCEQGIINTNDFKYLDYYGNDYRLKIASNYFILISLGEDKKCNLKNDELNKIETGDPKLFIKSNSDIIAKVNLINCNEL
jgi:hypothetical protein